MKKTRRIVSIGMAAIAAILMNVPAFAAAEESTPDSSAAQSQGIIQFESLPDQPDMPSVDDSAPEEPSSQEVPAQKPQSDLPLFVGAGISVLVFGGVVAFCRMKGNR